MVAREKEAARPGLLESATPFAVLARGRIALAVLNFPVAYHDAAGGHGFAMAGCAGFLAWMVVSYALLGRIRHAALSSALLPAADVLAAVVLVGATGGAGSSLTGWISLGALGTVVVRRRRDAALVGLLAALSILYLGAFENHGLPLSTLTVVRAVWSVVFAWFGYLIGSSRQVQLRLLNGLEAFTAEVGAATEASRALDAFRRAVEAIARPTSVVLRLEVFETPTRPRLDAGPTWLRIPIVSGGHDLGEAHVGRERPFAPQERQTLQLVGERLASALLRIRLGAELVEEAARQERLAIADEMHDTTIQTLVGLDLGATLIQRLVPVGSEAHGVAGELAEEARGHVAHVRSFLRDTVSDRVPGPETLAALFEERWAGRFELRLDPSVRLSEGRWRLVGLMAREGLNNARKHGGATQVSLDLNALDGEFEARLEADGATPNGDMRIGYGLTRLRAVAAAQHATVDLRPRPGGGSILSVRALRSEP